MLLAVHISRWYLMLKGDWDFSAEEFRTAIFKFWATLSGDRNIPGWNTDIKEFTLVSKTKFIQSDKILTWILQIKWSLGGDGLNIADFEEQKDEARMGEKAPCGAYNKGLTTAITRVQDVMASVMSGEYGHSFSSFIKFLTRDESIILVGGDQLAYNFHLAMNRVSSALERGADLKLTSRGHMMNGPATVSVAISASLFQQMEFMKDEQLMRSQNDNFRDLLKLMKSRAAGGDDKTADKAKGGSIKEAAKEAAKDQQLSKKQKRELSEQKKIVLPGSQGGRDSKVEASHRNGFLCMRFLGGSLGVLGKDSKVIKCAHGDDCTFHHKPASVTTLLEAEAAMSKTKDCAVKRKIQVAISAYGHFKK
jgi:hypothetical protein